MPALTETHRDVDKIQSCSVRDHGGQGKKKAGGRLKWGRRRV